MPRHSTQRHTEHAACRLLGTWACVATSLLLAVVCFGPIGTATQSVSAPPGEASHILAAGQAAILERHYREAIRLLKGGLERFPADNRIRVELGRAYLANHQDAPAIKLFREALRREPNNRLARLGLARVLAYRRDWKASDPLYRALLKPDEHDEAAEIGLAGNLIHQGRRAEAQQIVAIGLEQHPNSLVLQEYADRLQQAKLGADEREPAPRPNRVQTDADYVSDTAGNVSWRSSQRFDYQLSPSLSNQVTIEERWLRHGGRPPANVAAGTDEIQLRLSGPLALTVGGGGVRFADGTDRALYRTALDYHPADKMWLQLGFSRSPFYPDTHAARFDLTTEGWLAIFDWHPGLWQANVWWSRQQFSDGNVGRRGSAEVLRWIGTSRLAVGGGYRFTRYDFKEDPGHGYFSPDEYQSHLGITGLRVRMRKVFTGEYLVRAGGESLGRGAPFQAAWEASLRNRAFVGNWELGADYFYFHLTQSTGAYGAQAGRVVVAYHF